jgi:hypothetical protein
MAAELLGTADPYTERTTRATNSLPRPFCRLRSRPSRSGLASSEQLHRLHGAQELIWQKD